MDNIEALPPFPEGWYFIASRKSILKNKLVQKTWMGEEIVVWCDDKGHICVARAICPHMGSHLGPAAGGRVRNGCLVCPFHKFEFDASGQCVATPNAPAPRTARLEIFETREILGLVFAWWGSGGRSAQWNLPDAPPVGAEWSETGFRSFRFPGHPQETTENVVDLAHLRHTHGYDKVCQTGPVMIDSAYLNTSFDFRRIRKITEVFDTMYEVSAVAHIYGLGYSYVEVHEKSIDMHSRLWVLATPVDGTLIDLVLVSQVRELRDPKRPLAGLRFIPMRLRHKVMNQIILSAQKRDVLQDVTIWSRKRYRPRPRLSRSDGEVMTYRRYCRQFYPELYSKTGRGERKLSAVTG